MCARKILKGIGLQNARMCFSGAAPLPMPTMEWFKKYLGIDILQGYGMTENSIYASCQPSRRQPHRPRRQGNARSQHPRSPRDGEILYKHPGVMAGYYKDPEKTKETFTEDGYLRTGDKGRLDADGYLYITGRVKDIFKTLKGKYVAPAPIEGALARNTDIDQLCFVGSGLKQPIMLVSLTPGARSRSRDEVGKGLIADMQLVNKNLENARGDRQDHRGQGHLGDRQRHHDADHEGQARRGRKALRRPDQPRGRKTHATGVGSLNKLQAGGVNARNLATSSGNHGPLACKVASISARASALRFRAIKVSACPCATLSLLTP